MNTKVELMTMKRHRNSGMLFISGWIVFALVTLLGGLDPSDVLAKSKP